MPQKWRERLKIRKEKRLKWKVRQATQKREVKKEIKSTNSHIKNRKELNPTSNEARAYSSLRMGEERALEGEKEKVGKRNKRY